MSLRRVVVVAFYLSFGAGVSFGGAILREVYEGISGTSVSDLTNNPAYPNSPSSTNWITDLFEAPADHGDNYGQRLRGYIVPPETGYYTFWISSDDASELWVSTTPAPTNTYVLAARVAGWTNPREWTRETNQQSGPVSLVAGRLYAVYALMKEGGGGDNLAVRWRRPNGSMEEPIPATCLLPPGGPFAPPNLVAQSDTNTVGTENESLALSVTVSNLYPVAYQWQRNGSNIASAIASTFAISSLVMTNDGEVFGCIISNALGSVTSAPIRITVLPDTNGPTVAAVYRSYSLNVSVVFSEPVQAASATNLANYTLTGGTLLAAGLGGDGVTLGLNVTGLVFGGTYTLTISNVMDRAATPNMILPGTQRTFTMMPLYVVTIGWPAQQPRSSYGNDTNTIELTGLGLGFRGDHDACVMGYVYQTGDFDVAAQLTGIDFVDAWEEAGIMARETPGEMSDFAAALATPTINGAYFAYRKFSMLMNPGFESGQGIGLSPAGWDGDWYAAHALTNGTVLDGPHVAPATARTGTWMLMLTNNAQLTGTNWHGVGQFFPCTPGESYEFGSYYQIQSNLPPQHATFLKIEWYDAATNRLYVNDVEGARHTNKAAFWNFDSAYAVAPSGAAKGKAVFLYEDLDTRTNSPAEKFLVYWDDSFLWHVAPQTSVRDPSVPLNGPDTWLRLKRAGHVFTGYISYDDQRWTVLGSMTDDLPATVYLGMVVSSHSTSIVTTARFRDWGDVTGGTTGRQDAVSGEGPGPSSRRTGVVLSEILYNPAPRQDGRDVEFIELFNSEPFDQDLGGWSITGSVSYVFPPGTTLRAGAFLVVAAQPSDVQAAYGITGVLGGYAGHLPNGSGVVQLRNNLNALLLDIEYTDHLPWPAAADGSGPSMALTRPSYGEDDPRAWSASAMKGGSPGQWEPVAPSPYASLRINEILSHTDLPQLDYAELFNAGGTSIDISGFTIRVDTNNYVIPASTVIPGRGFVYFTETQMGFKIEKEGGTVALLDAQDTRVVDLVTFGTTINGSSIGRYPDGADGIQELAAPTAGSNNAARLVRDIVINEVMFHPISNDDNDEYVELYNRGSSNVNVGSWRLSDGISFTIPAGTVMPPGGFLVIAKNLTNLLARYPQLNTTNAVGNNSGKMSDHGERIALEMPEDPLVPTKDFVLVDEVTYSDGWGAWADGDGSSLELVDAHGDNSLASAWAGSDETAKSAWTNLSVSGVLDNGNGAADEFHLLLQGDGECLVDNVVALRTVLNRVTNNTFDAGMSGWLAQGNHMRTGWDATNGVGGTGCLHIRASGGGDTGANRIETTLSSAFTPGDTITNQVTARWLCGHPDLLARIRGGWLELAGTMPVPRNLGTPGQTNSRAVANAGPAISYATHAPSLPAASEDVVVSARVHDPDGVGSVVVRYRVDPLTVTNTVTMRDDGTGGDLVVSDGVLSATIGGLAAGSLVTFRITAVDGAGSPGTNVYPDPARAEAVIRFGDASPPGNFGAYHMWITRAMIDAWTNAPNLSNEFWPGTFVSGSRVIYNAGAHYRGSTFLRPTYDNPTGALCAYRIDIPKSDRFLGVDELNLDSLEPWRDNTRQRERTIFWMAGKIGLPGSHQRNIALYLNGTRRSDVYSDVFHVEGDYVECWYPENPDGEIFKLDDWFEFTNNAFTFTYGVDHVDARLAKFTTTGGAYKQARYRWNFEKKSNGGLNDDYGRIFDLVDAMTETNDASYILRASGLVDVDEWAGVFALRHVTCDWDGYGYSRGKNAYIYKAAGLPWKMLPWDYDFGLGTPDSHPVDSSLFREVQDPAISNRFLNAAPFRRAFLQAAKALVDGPMLYANVNPMVEQYYEALVANGINAYSPGDMEDWIGLRRNYLLTQVQAWDAPFAITNNGGAAFSTNGNFISLGGTAPLSVRGIKVNGILYTPAWATVSNWMFAITLGPGVNSLDVRGVDENGVEVGGASASIQVTYTGGGGSPVGSLVINEIMYHPTNDGAEFVEIYNRSTNYAYDLYNCQLAGLDLTITNSVVVPPNGFAVVSEDPAAFAATYGAVPVAAAYPGALDDAGEWIRLQQLNGTNPPTLVDEVRVEARPPWPTNADGLGPSLQLIDAAEDNTRVGNWGVDVAIKYTPGATNSITLDLPSFPLLWINELQASNTLGIVDNATNRDPWLELFSQVTADLPLTNFYLTDTYTNLTKWVFPAGAYAPSNAFRLVWLDNQAAQTAGTNYHATFRPGTTNGAIALVVSNGSNIVIVDYMNYPALATNLSYGDYPDGAWTNRAVFQVPTPGASNSPSAAAAVNIKINEFMADNVASGVLDPYGEIGDWVELFNDGTNSVDLTDFGFTDNLSQPFKWRMPTGVVMAGKSYLMVWADNAPANQTIGVHANWALGKGGEAIGLYKADGTLVDAFSFGAQATDVTQGRWPDGAAGIVTLGYPTPAAANVSTNNTPPSLGSLGNTNVDEQALLNFTVTATDTDTPVQALTFSLDAGAPTNASIDATNGIFAWTPGEEQGPATNAIGIRVTDNGYLNRSAVQTISVAVAEVNQAPVLQALGPFNVSLGSQVRYQVVAQDGDIPANTLTFGLPLTDGGQLTAGGLFTWTPADVDALTTNESVVTVSDDGVPLLSDTGLVQIVVSAADQLFEATAQPEPSGAGVVVRWSADSGEVYRVYFADDVTGLVWTALSGDVAATSAIGEKVDATTNVLEQRFYRVIRLLP